MVCSLKVAALAVYAFKERFTMEILGRFSKSREVYWFGVGLFLGSGLRRKSMKILI